MNIYVHLGLVLIHSGQTNRWIEGLAVCARDFVDAFTQEG